MDAVWATHRGKFPFRSFATRQLPHEVRLHMGDRRWPATLTAPGRRGRVMRYAGVVLDVPTVACYATEDDGNWLVKAAMWSPLKGEAGGVGLIAYRAGTGGFEPEEGDTPFFGEDWYGVFEYDGRVLRTVREAADGSRRP